MSIKLFHSIYSYALKLGCDRPRKNLLEGIKNKIRKIDIFSAIYINIKVVTTTNSKIGLQRSLQNLMLDFSKKKSQIGPEFSSENDFEPRFSISLHCAEPRQAVVATQTENFEARFLETTFFKSVITIASKLLNVESSMTTHFVDYSLRKCLNL